MPYQTHGLRHDTDHLFAKLLAEDKWLMTPCAVLTGADQITLVRAAGALLTWFPDDAPVICPWPGKARQDVFEFTVGQFRAYARDHTPGGTAMTCCEKSKRDDLMDEVRTRMSAAVDAVREVAKAYPSREASLAATNIEQSQMWLDRASLPVQPAAQPTEEAAE
jgi:hypothetical protein